MKSTGLTPITEGLGYFNFIPSSCLAIGEETNVEKQTSVYVSRSISP